MPTTGTPYPDLQGGMLKHWKYYPGLPFGVPQIGYICNNHLRRPIPAQSRTNPGPMPGTAITPGSNAPGTIPAHPGPNPAQCSLKTEFHGRAMILLRRPRITSGSGTRQCRFEQCLYLCWDGPGAIPAQFRHIAIGLPAQSRRNPGTFPVQSRHIAGTTRTKPSTMISNIALQVPDLHGAYPLERVGGDRPRHTLSPTLTQPQHPTHSSPAPTRIPRGESLTSGGGGDAGGAGGGGTGGREAGTAAGKAAATAEGHSLPTPLSECR